MKIVILASGSAKQSTQKLIEGLKKSRASIKVIDPMGLRLQLSPTEIFYQGKALVKPDLLIPRLGWLSLDYGLSVVEAFESLGVQSLNSAKSLRSTTNKWLCLSLLAKENLPIPPGSFCINSNEDIYQAINLGGPLVFKLFTGSQGMGVSIAKTPAEIKAWIDFLRSAKVSFFVQKFLQGSELRVLVHQGRVLGAIKRTPQKGDFRSNLFQGGRAQAARLSEEEKNLALQATHILGLDLAGVDLMRTKKGTCVLEVNAFPGLVGISQSLKTDFAKKIATSLVSSAR